MSFRHVIKAEKDAVGVIAQQLWTLAKEHPKKAAMFVLFELWVHGLMFHHLQEVRDMFDLIPFFRH